MPPGISFFDDILWRMLLVEGGSHVNGASYCAAYHRVVADSEESHHLHVSRYGRRACELCIAVHTSHSVGHTVGSRTCSHVVRMERASCSTAGSYREVRLACECALFLVCTCYRVLEACRVCRVTCDGNVNAFFPHYCNAFAYIVSTVAFHFRARTF